jgi:hypothetical protein
VVTVWPKKQQLLRTRRNRPVFAFWNVTVPSGFLTKIHCWLRKPPPAGAVCTVTLAPGLKDLLVMASPRLNQTTSAALIWQPVHRVVLLNLGFSRTVAPLKVVLGVPAWKLTPLTVMVMWTEPSVVQGALRAAAAPALATPAVAKVVPAASTPAASMEIKRRIIPVPRPIFVSVLSCRQACPA